MPSCKKYYLEIFLAVVAVVACIASIRSCSIAEQAEETARKTLKTSKQHFVAENRPFLKVNPAKFEDSKEYCEFFKTDNSKVLFRLRFRIENIGNVAALNISSPDDPTFFDRSGRVEISETRKPANITLGPGDHVYRFLDIIMTGKDPDWATKTVSELMGKMGRT